MSYRQRRERRVHQLRGIADRREAEAESLRKQNEPYRGDVAFNTQPGHIPERARAIRRDERAWEASKDASARRAKAAEIERQLERAIYNDDPDAIERIEERIAELEAKRAEIKEANRRTRAEGRDAAPAYILQNLGQRIRTYRQRLEALRNPAPHRRRTITARRRGECVRCTTAIEPGESITEVAPRRWTHAACATSDDGRELIECLERGCSALIFRVAARPDDRCAEHARPLCTYCGQLPGMPVTGLCEGCGDHLQRSYDDWVGGLEDEADRMAEATAFMDDLFGE